MKQLYDRTWAELDQGVRIFLLVGDERALVIDSGMTGLNIMDMVRQHTDLPVTLLNTHADRDHTGGNAQFDKVMMHPAEIAVYRNAQAFAGTIEPVFEGDLIDLGGRVLEIVFLPGHTPGSIAVLDRAARSLIGGDPIQENGDIYMFGAHRSMEAYIASLERLETRDDFDFIYPSHAKEKISRAVIPELISGAEKILSGELKGTDKEVHGIVIASCDAGVSRFLCEKR